METRGCIMLRKVRNAYKNISQETQNEIPLKNTDVFGEHHTQVDLSGTGCESVGWIQLALERD
jgi:fibrillarin-like rRNA methylase